MCGKNLISKKSDQFEMCITVSSTDLVGVLFLQHFPSLPQNEEDNANKEFKFWCVNVFMMAAWTNLSTKLSDHNDLFSDRYTWANSADPDQAAPRGAA